MEHPWDLAPNHRHLKVIQEHNEQDSEKQSSMNGKHINRLKPCVLRIPRSNLTVQPHRASTHQKGHPKITHHVRCILKNCNFKIVLYAKYSTHELHITT